MANLYRLEFNEKQQSFHLDNYTHGKNTVGWYCICESISDFEFKVFESFINRNKNTIHTKESALKSLIEVKSFMINLLEYNLTIS